jgi:hypothetical protein
VELDILTTDYVSLPVSLLTLTLCLLLRHQSLHASKNTSSSTVPFEFPQCMPVASLVRRYTSDLTGCLRLGMRQYLTLLTSRSEYQVNQSQ